jgi:hypothetical protein
VNNGSTDDRGTYPVKGRYFYRRYGVTIHVVGMPLQDDTLRLREYKRLGGFTDEFTADWRLTIRGDNANGVFCRCDLSEITASGDATLKVSLKRVSHEFHGEFQPRERSESEPVYDQLLLDYPLKNGSEIHVNKEIAYAMQSDPRFNVRRPRLTRFPNLGVMTKINSQMAADLRWDRLQATGNLSEAQLEASVEGFYDESTTVSFFPPDILSVRVDRTWYWGGAHPNHAIYALNYNLHTGERFTLKNAFQTAAGHTGEADLAALLAGFYRKHYVKPAGTVSAEDCSDVLNRITSDSDYLIDSFSPDDGILFMSGKGLVIRLALKYTDSGCGPDVTVPYSELRPFVKEDSMLRLILDRGKTSR